MTDGPEVNIDEAVNQVKQRVQTFLPRQWNTELKQDGGWMCRFDSTVVHINVRTIEGSDATYVVVWAPILWNVPYTTEVADFVARESRYFFGHVFIDDDDEPGTVKIIFEHSLLGDYLDEAEIHYAVGAVGNTANRLDDELKARFGGKRQIDL